MGNALLDLLKSTANSSIVQGVEKINTFIKKLQMYLTMVVNFLSKILDNLMYFFIENIDVIVNKILLAGKDTSNCIRYEMKKLTALPKHTVEEIKNCLDESFKKINQLGIGTKTSLLDIFHIVVSLSEMLKTCNEMNDYLCLNKITKKLRKQLVAIPTQVEVILQKFLISIPGQSCFPFECFNVVNVMVGNSVKIVLKMLNCLMHLIFNT